MKFLIIDDMHPSISTSLREIGCTVTYLPDANREDLLNNIGEYEGLIFRSKTKIDAEVIEKASKLKLVCRAGAGIDNVDVNVLQKHGIELLNAPEGNRDALAEHCVALLLSILNHIPRSDRQIRNNIWDREGNRGVELKGKTIGLLGYGYMAEAFAKRLAAFGCNIIAHDAYNPCFEDNNVEEVSLEALKQRSDILSIHIPLDEKNKGLINKRFLLSFKKLQYLINTSRGEVLVLKDLVELLEDHSIQAAALDVLENEKINRLSSEEQQVFDRLIQLDNVVLSPHVAGWSIESYERINQVLIQKIKKFIEFSH